MRFKITWAALHVASSFGHSDIVRILLHERGVMKHRRNRDVIHGDQRGSENKKNDDESPSKKWVDLVADENHTRGLQISQTVGKTLFCSPFVRSITFAMFNCLLNDQFAPFENEASVRDFLLRLIDTHVTRNDPEYNKACELVNEFAQTKRIEPLLRLYTLETPLYRQLHYESHAWLLPLICHFNNLKPRFFQGTSCRGLSMKSQELRAYRLACGKSSCIIRTNTFCSTSSDRHVAEEFSNECSNSDLIHVLMIFEFLHLFPLLLCNASTFVNTDAIERQIKHTFRNKFSELFG
ncbi:unnamed protein product [Rotaria socialis]|uniref:Ankyrin repeat protein n=1 Tax=Rotaria socialis TaxID=392032 RepID=A0A817WHP0_9BILA|nr:unnamed protein product [Rotaria socialis]